MDKKVSKEPDMRDKPRFLQIIEYLRSQIREGDLAEHAPLPSERVIAEEFDVSRMTARRALIAAETEGLAYSLGRKGRFVSPSRLRYDIGRTFSFSKHAQETALNLQIKLIAVGECAADAKIAKALALELNDKVYRYTRLFLINDHPTFLETEFLPAERFPDFLENDLEQSTALLLENNYSSPVETIDVTIRMCNLLPEEVSLLGLQTIHSAIELEQISHDAKGHPFCFDRQIWRGELAEFSARAVISKT